MVSNDIYILGSSYHKDKKKVVIEWIVRLIKSNKIDECVPLKTFGCKQTARSSHSAVHIAPIDAIFINGGFDHRLCSTPRLFFSNDYHWFDMINIKGSHSDGIRATHTSCARYRRANLNEIPNKKKKEKEQNWC